MIKRVVVRLTRFVQSVKMAAASPTELATTPMEADDTKVGEKRSLETTKTEEPDEKKVKVEGPPAPPMQGRMDRKRKVALLLAYCGAGYYGIQRNLPFPTIEEELLKALVTTGLIPQDHADSPQKMSFQRAARTDKGVSAAGNVVSLKMLLNQKDLIETINSHLPAQIRVIAYRRATQGFNSKNHCSARTYTYMLPTYSFAPFEKFVTEEYRTDDETLKRVSEILSLYKGTHNFHNFTSGIKPDDPSAKRYIISFECGKPFVQDNIEFVILTVKGQSFILHHIRKMIGLMIPIVKGYCGVEVIAEAWKSEKVDVPKAPGVGLLLEQLHYAGYNKKFGKDGMHEPIEWDEYKEKIKKFKEEYIISHVIKSEKDEKVMLRWLGTLQFHKFDLNADPDQTDWWGTRRILKNTEKMKEENSSAVIDEIKSPAVNVADKGIENEGENNTTGKTENKGDAVSLTPVDKLDTKSPQNKEETVNTSAHALGDNGSGDAAVDATFET